MLRSHPDVEFYAVSCDAHADICQKYETEDVPSLKVFRQGPNQEGILVELEDPESDHYSPDLLANLLELQPPETVGENDNSEEISNEEEEFDGITVPSEDTDVDFPEETEPKSPAVDMATKRNPEAGHILAKHQPKALDRYKADFQAQREALQKRRNRLGAILRMDNQKGKEPPPQQSEVMTEGMKAFTPGTPEFLKRTTNIQKRVDKAKKIAKNKLGNNNVGPQGKANTPITRETLPYRKEVRKETLAKKVVEIIPLIGNRLRLTPEEILMLDVTNSFVVAMESINFATGGKGLDYRKKERLRGFLELLSISLPAEWGIHRLIHTLLRRFDFITKEKENFKRVLDTYPLPRRKWSKSCSPTPKKNGFLCGFWKLLHVATVGIAELKGGMSMIESGMLPNDVATFSPYSAAETIRDYIDSFFFCETCRERFLVNYDNCDNNRRCARLTEEEETATIADWKELPLWLWEVHNEVSVGIVSESELSAIAVLWPNIATCLMCFDEDGSWNEAEVFKHLETTYWPDSQFDPLAERLIHYDADASFRFGIYLWVLMLFILLSVSAIIGKSSPGGIQQSILRVKQLARADGGKKLRSS